MKFFIDLQSFLTEVFSPKVRGLFWNKHVDMFTALAKEYSEVDINSLSTDLDAMHVVELQAQIEILEKFLSSYHANIAKFTPRHPHINKINALVEKAKTLHTLINEKIEKVEDLRRNPTGTSQAYQTWVGSQPILEENTHITKGVIVRIFLPPVKKSVLGVNTSGHISLEVFDSTRSTQSVYLSFAAKASNLTPKQAGNLLQKLHLPASQSRPGVFNSLAIDKRNLELGRYSSMHEVVIDCSDNNFLNTAAIYDKVLALKNQTPLYNFYYNNCTIMAETALNSGHNKNHLKSSITPTPLSLFERYRKFSVWTNRNRFMQAAIPKEQSWNDLLSYFNRQLCLLDPTYLDYYLNIQHHPIALPHPNKWSSTAHDDIDSFVKHVQTLALGLAQKNSISKKEVLMFVQSTHEILQTFSTTDERIEGLQHALINITQRLKEQKISLGVQTSSLREKLSLSLSKTLKDTQSDIVLTHAQKVFSTINSALHVEGDLHQQLQTTLQALQRLERLSKKSTPGFSKKFYAQGRDILHEHLKNIKANLNEPALEKKSAKFHTIAYKMFKLRNNAAEKTDTLSTTEVLQSSLSMRMR